MCFFARFLGKFSTNSAPEQNSEPRARKLYTSARIYEWKFGKGEWKLPYASPTGRVDFFGFVIIFEGKKKN